MKCILSNNFIYLFIYIKLLDRMHFILIKYFNIKSHLRAYIFSSSLVVPSASLSVNCAWKVEER